MSGAASEPGLTFCFSVVPWFRGSVVPWSVPDDTTKLFSSPGFRASRPANICSASISSTTSSVKSQCLLIRIEVSMACK